MSVPSLRTSPKTCRASVLFLREPYIVGCCGYRFCRTCIQPIQKLTRKCPLCNSGFSCLPDRQLERILREKLVYCSNKSNGCFSEIVLGSLEDHLKTCPHQNVPCPYCKVLFKRSSNLSVVHYNECPMYPVPCPNGCGAKPFRKNLLKHIDYSCPNRVQECFFKYAGCNVQLTNKEMLCHVKEYESKHWHVTAAMIKELRDKNTALRRVAATGEHL